MNEIWKEIEGVDGYMVSNRGNVKDARGPRNIYERGKRSQVSLKNGCKFGMYDVSRLVAKAFLPNPHGLDTVIHKDGDYHNNKVSNLEWSNRSGCPVYVKRRKKSKRGCRQYKEINSPRKRAVLKVSKSGEVLESYSSAYGAVRALGLNSHGIYMCLNGKLKSSGGYRWIYAE